MILQLIYLLCIFSTHNYLKSYPAIAESINMKHIKEHYYTSHPEYNTFAVIPTANGPDLLEAHERHFDQK